MKRKRYTEEKIISILKEHDAEDRQNKSAVRESGRLSELKCLELLEGIVPGFAVMQQNHKQHLVKVWLVCRVISQAGC